MKNLATGIIDTSAVQEFGQVTDKDGIDYCVETGSGTYAVRRAVSCLVEPEVGDKVLCVFGSEGPGYALAILEKDPDAEAGTILSFDDDAQIRTPSGRLDITARDGVDIGGGEEVRIAAGRLAMTAGQAEAHFGKMSFWSGAVEAGTDVIKLTADRIESFVGRTVQFMKNSFRRVEETDQIDCGRLNYKADKSLQLRGEFTQMTAEGDVHIDGERINIG